MAVKHSLPAIKSFGLEKFKMIAAKSSIQIIFSDNDLINKKVWLVIRKWFDQSALLFATQESLSSRFHTNHGP